MNNIISDGLRICCLSTFPLVLDLPMIYSTSGNSENVLNAVYAAKKMNIKTVGLLGRDGGRIASEVDFALVVNSLNTARIQEVHIFLGHVLCAMIESSAPSPA